MILYHYERHHFEFMQECLDANITSPSKVRNTWPFTDMIPTAGSLNRRLVSLAEYGIEKCALTCRFELLATITSISSVFNPISDWRIE
jgi:hypothetical protein